jgi:D-3-phosphoglycerate dehydrogenase
VYKVLITDNLTEEALEVFERYPDIQAVRTGTLAKKELIETIADCDAVIVRSPTRLSGDIIASSSKLKYIGRAGAGCDNVDIDAATRRGITIMNAPSGNTISTAEHTFALMLSLLRDIPGAHNSVSAGQWNRKQFRGTELYGKTLGIIGLGRVGGEVARRAVAFSMTVQAADPFVDPGRAEELGVRLTELEPLLQSSDIVTIHVPLNDGTHKMISREQMNAMKEGAYLINCARGGVVDEDALAEACRSGKLAGAAVDVFSSEPPGDNPLLSVPHTVLSPHIGGATGEAHIRVAVDISLKIAEALTKGVVKDAVNR